ncbi:MAG: hypothetical protein HC883_03365 [Bdellovibrionaceae bacterium]|nr:hypothetical protein [Pseudobdellovibrionaceae bacterium]
MAASIFSVIAAFMPWWQGAVIFVISGVTLKVFAKALSSEARGFFRRAERLRRYDFEERTLGWPLPPRERADLRISNSEIAALAKKWADRETGYYSNEGPPSDARLYSNLAESIFWSERLMGKMATRRWKQVLLALGATVVTLLATIILQNEAAAGPVIKILAVAVSLLVTLDVFGEARSFQRGERELAQIIAALTADGQNNIINRNEILRILIEYNCLLAELPMIPDEVYTREIPDLNQAWDAYRSGVASL